MSKQNISLAQAYAPQENGGLADLEQYAGDTLPAGFEFTAMLGDIIMAIYADTAEGSNDLLRNGIVLPVNVVDQKAWRVAKAVLVGPRSNIKVGEYFIFPGDRGIKGIQKDGKHVIFLNEDRIFGICKPTK